MAEITELDMNKYLVLKWDDIHNELSPRQRVLLISMMRTCNIKRIERQGGYNKYLVLNLDDEIDLMELLNILEKKFGICSYWKKVKVADIAVALVNVILKAKEG